MKKNKPNFQYSKEERKKIPGKLYDEFKSKYPFYQEGQTQFHSPIIYPNNISTLKEQAGDSYMEQIISIGEPVKSVLCAACLSDASLRISKGYANARIQTRHSSRQKEWFFWKWMICLRPYIKGLSSVTFQNPDGYQLKSEAVNDEVLGKLKLASKTDDELTKLYKVMCPEGKEQINATWLNYMSNYFLMVVWLDDGSLYNKHQGCICLDASPKEEQELFVEYLSSAWGIEAYVVDTGDIMRDGRNRYRIYIKDMYSLLKLFRIIAPIIPVKEMLYKVMFVPVNNPILLQRWASELESIVIPEFRAFVRQEYANIIKKS